MKKNTLRQTGGILLLCLVASCTTVKHPTMVPTTLNSSKESLQSASQREKNTRQESVEENTAETINSWIAEGVLGYQDGKEAWSATFTWQQLGAENYKLHLIGAAGFGSATLSANKAGVTLVNSKNQTFKAKNSEALFKQQTGFNLPVANLYYWVRGIPVPHQPFEKTVDQAHLIKTLIQQGWVVQYLRYLPVKNKNLPTKLTMTHSSMKIKIVIHAWQIH